MGTTGKVFVGLFIAVVIIGAIWFIASSQSGNELASIADNPGDKLTEAQVKLLVGRLDSFVALPSGETPSVTVLADTRTLAEEKQFYKDAKDGDVLVVYSDRALIFDVRENKLVSYGSLDRVDESSATPTPTPSATPVTPEATKIEVRNGTTVAGLAGQTASDLKKNSWVTITKTGDATNSYKVVTIVDLSGGKRPGAVAALTQAYAGATVVTALPKGEAASTADILFIVGK